MTATNSKLRQPMPSSGPEHKPGDFVGFVNAAN